MPRSIDTRSSIIAPASGAGVAARAILRVSGAGCLALIGTPGRGAHRVRIADAPLLAYVYPGPRSYTGEDSFELLVARNADLLARVERALEDRAAAERLPWRRAAPGEFSLRAFLHGRIDLSQAEGVAATIAATTDAELAAARFLVAGRLGDAVRRLVEDLARDLALVEAGIDFTDQEDVTAIAPEALLRELRKVLEETDDLLAGSGGRERFDALPTIVLSGRPNAGKSTLFNVLVGRERAVASPSAGTTRDLLVERIALGGGAEALLSDTAGIEDVESRLDHLDGAARRAAIQARDEAELILHCVATDDPSSALDVRQDHRTLLVRTKADLPLASHDDGVLAVSAHDGRGIDRLRRLLAERLAARRVAAGGVRAMLHARHREAIARARERLHDAIDLVVAHHLSQPELVAADMRLALDALGDVTGAIAPDDVLGRIFASFCVGK